MGRGILTVALALAFGCHIKVQPSKAKANSLEYIKLKQQLSDGEEAFVSYIAVRD